MDVKIIHFDPDYGHNYGIAVAERKDGRQYDVEICNGVVCGVYALGRRRVNCNEKKIGRTIAYEVQTLVISGEKRFTIIDGEKVVGSH